MDDEPPFGRPQENQGNERSGRQRSEERLSSLLLLYDLVILSKRLMMGAGKWDLTGRDGGPRGRASCLLRPQSGADMNHCLAKDIKVFEAVNERTPLQLAAKYCKS